MSSTRLIKGFRAVGRVMVEHSRRIEPLAIEWRSFSWTTGTFDAGRRDYTQHVQGVIALPHHLVLVTLAGGARRLQVTAECGHRFVAFKPASFYAIYVGFRCAYDAAG